MPIIGNTGRFDQLYLAKVDPLDVENETRTIENIFTGDLEASNVFTSNIGLAGALNPSHNFQMGSNLFMDDLRSDGICLEVQKKVLLHDALFASQIGINNQAPQYALDILDSNGQRVFFVDVDNPTNAITVDGGIAMGALTARSAIIGNDTSNVVIDTTSSDLLVVNGNLLASKVTAIDGLSFGSNILLNDTAATVLDLTGNVTMTNSIVEITGNLKVTGNLEVTDFATYTQPTNLAVESPVIQMGVGATAATDTAILFHQYDESNAFIGFLHDVTTPAEFVVGRTQAAPNFVEITPTSEEVNVHVLGKVFVDSNVCVGNTNPHHQFSLGSNLFMEDTGSNVLYTSGNIHANYISVGEQIILGSNVTIDDDGETVLEVTGNAQFSNLYTSERVIIANTNPGLEHSLCIGDTLHAHATPHMGNVLVVHGNTVSTNLIATSNVAVGRLSPDETLHVEGNIRIGGTVGVDDNADRFIKSTGQLVVHANDAGSDDAYSGLVLKSGPTASKVGAIEIRGTTTESNIVFKTNDAEKMRISNDGFVGVANVAPTQALTVGGNIQVTGTNAGIFGNAFSESNVSMRLYADTVTGGRTHLQSRVKAGEGFNVTVTSASGLGTPNVTIKDTGRVGVGTTQPEGILQTNGGTTSPVYINKQVVQRGSFTHTAPLVATSTHVTDTVALPVVQLCREGKSAGSEHGQRVDLKLSKFATGTNSRTKLDFDLAHASYDAVRIMTLRSDGRVGVGTETPSAPLEVKSGGTQNIAGNGLLVKNSAEGEDSIVTVQTAQTGATYGDAFTSYAIYNAAVSPNYFGWSVGVDNRNNAQKHFRITSNVTSVSNVEATAFFIDGDTSNVGIGTDNAVAKFTVDGDVQIGNKFSFKGLEFQSGSSDDDKKNGTYAFEHTFLEEREYTNSGRSELLFFKGNDFASGGPDHIRHVAGRHMFQVYRDEVDDDIFQDILDDVDDTATNGATFESVPVLTISGLGQNKGRLLLHQGVGDEANAGDYTTFFMAGEFLVRPFSDRNSRISTTYMHMLSDDAQTQNIIDSVEGGYQLIFKTAPTGADTGNSDERMRITEAGLVGIGTVPNANLHCYSGLTSVDVLKVESAASATGTSKTGIQIVNDDDYGALVRGFKDVTNSRSGLILGTTHNGTESEVVYLTSDDRVGVNTDAPSTGFHVYDTTPRFEHSSSNAVVELTSSGGTSNIQCGTNGDVYIHPVTDTSNVFVQGNLRVSSNIQFDGTIEFGAQAGLGIGIASPATALHVEGGCILNSDNVARKSYSTSFFLASSSARDIILKFDKGHFYAKVKAILREASNGNRVSTMVMELSGGTTGGTTASYAPVIGTKNLFGNRDNTEPWSSDVSTAATSAGNFVYLKPLTAGVQGALQRSYYYDVYVKVISSNSAGKLLAVQYDRVSTKTIQTFDY
jgi:hypothetical protein